MLPSRLRGLVTALVTAVALLRTIPVHGMYTEDSPVVSLTPKTFKSRATTDVANFYLVAFYAPWCGHCKKLAPEYEAAAVLLRKARSPAVLAAVDCDAHTQLCDRHQVRGFPLIRAFLVGRANDAKGNSSGVETYQGAWDKDGIVEFVNLKVKSDAGSDDPLAPKLPYSDVHAFLHHGNSKIPKVVLLTSGVSSGSKSNLELSWLSTVAVKFKVGKKKNANFAYARVDDDKGAVARNFGVTKFPSVVCVKVEKSDGGRFVVLELGEKKVGDTIRETKAFIDSCAKMDPSDDTPDSKPLPSFPPPRKPRKVADNKFGELTEDNLHEACFGGFSGTCVVLAISKDSSSELSSKEALNSISKKYRNDPFSFLWVDTGDAGSQSFLKGFGLDGKKNPDVFPALIAVKTGKRDRFAVKKFDKGLTEKIATSFVDGILGGDVTFTPLKVLPEFEPEYLRRMEDDETGVEVVVEIEEETSEAESDGDVVEVTLTDDDGGEEITVDLEIAPDGDSDEESMGEL